MASFNYSRSVNTAIKLIVKYGQVMTLESVTAEPYDTETGEAAVSSIDITITGVIFEISGKLIGKSLQNGTLATTNDKQCLIDSRINPNLLDKIVVDTDVFMIINKKEINPGGVVVLYDLVLRSG